MSSRVLLFPVLLLAIQLTVFPAHAVEMEKNWKKVIDKLGIQVYRAHTEDSKFKSFKSVIRMEIDNIQAFVGLMYDNEAYSSWIHMLSTAELTQGDDPREYSLWLLTKMPWPVKDRHTKVDVSWTQLDDYSLRFDAVKSSVPPPENKSAILAPEAYGYYLMKTIPGSKEVEVTVEMFVDPGGYIPAFLVNLITDDMSYYTARKFRRIILTDKYQNYSNELVKRRPWVVSAEE